MEAYLRPLVSCRLYTTIFRQRKIPLTVEMIHWNKLIERW